MRIAISVVLIGLLAFSYPVFSQVTCNLSLIATPTGATCSSACNGSVSLTPVGGTAPYSFNSFDHTFPGTSIDTGLFDVRNGNFSVSGNQLTALADPLAATDFDNSIATKQVFPDNGKIVTEASFYLDYNTYANFGLAEDAAISDQSQLPFAFFFNYGELYIVSDGVWTQMGSYASNTWYDLKIEKLGSTVNYYIRNTGLATYTLLTSTTSSLSLPGYKLAAVYYNFYSNYGGFKTRNWRVGGNPPTSGLCPGTYTYTVFDAVGCFATASVNIGTASGPGSLQLTGAVTGASCQASNDGSISLTPTGGTGPYSYGFSHVFSGGSINSSIFDMRNGDFSQGGDLREGIGINHLNSWDNSISTSQTFSDGGYLLFEGSFKFDPNAEVIFGFTNTGVISDLSNVMFGFRVSNGSSLYSYTNSLGLQQVTPITPNTWYDFKIEKIGNVVSFYYRPQNTGSYILRFSTSYISTNFEYKAAALNYSSSFSSSAGYNTTGWNIESTPKITKLSPGTYTYTVTDASGCTSTAVFNVPLGNANGVTLTASLVNGSLSNGSTGAVNLIPSGGTAPYKYQFEQSFTDTGAIDQGLFDLRNGAFSQGSGDLRNNAVATNLSFDNSLATKISFTDAGLISFAGSFKFDTGANIFFGLAKNSGAINDPSLLEIGFNANGTQLSGRAGSTSNQLLATIAPGTWYDLKVEKTNSLVKFYMRNTGSTGAYTLLFTMPYTGSATEFKAAAIAYGANGGFNSKNWIINSNPSTTGLAAGNYSYRVYDVKGCYATAVINVPSNGSFNATGQATNTSAWNICDGTAAISSATPGILNIAARPFYQSFSGGSLNTSLFTTRNGAFTQNGDLSSATLINNSGWDNSIVTSGTFTDNGSIVAEMEMKFHNASEVYFGFAPPTQAINNFSFLPYAFYYASGKLYAYTAAGGNVLIGSVTANQWYSYRIEKTGSQVNFYLRSSTETLYQLVYSATTNNTAGASYRIGIVNFFNNITGTDRSFNSRNWKVLNNAALSGLCLGTYSYTVSLPGTSPVDVTVNVGTNLPLAQTMVAPPNKIVNTDAGKAYASNVALGTPSFGGNPAGVTVTNNAPAQFPVGVSTVKWMATDAFGYTATGNQAVTVIDNEPPTISAPASLTVNALLGQTSVTGIALGTPVYADNVPGATVSNNAPLQFLLGTTTVTWTVTDAAGNTASATQTVTVVATQLPAITAPANITTSTNPGQAYATGVSLGSPTLSSNVPGVIVTNNAPSQFPLGTTTVTWTVSDGIGHSISAGQTVTVIDNEPPAVSAPANITVNTDAGQAYATNVSLGTPVYSDNVPGVTVSNNAPSQFPLGTTTVTWKATDAAGNTATAVQSVTVRDNELPVITAPANITVNTNPGVAYASGINLGTPVYSDNVPGATISNNAPSQFPLGTTTVTWKVKDAAGNTATATQLIFVNDNEPPTITAPADVTVNINSGLFATGVNLGTPAYHDNAPGAVVSNNAPSQYPMGVTTVTWTVKDAAGNTATANQKVTVVAPLPTITAPPTVTATANASGYATGVNLGSASYTVSVNPAVVTNNAPSQFPIGTTTVTWTVTDGLNRTATATQSVIVKSGCQPYITTITSIPTNSTYTGGITTNLYLGYGAQSTKLQVTVPNTAGPYTYQWIGSGLSSMTSAAPIFTPATAGVYTFYITVKNVNGCISNASVTICVKDVRVLDKNGNWDGKKVYLCHRPPGNPSNAQLLSVGISAVSAHLGNHDNDVLGSCTQACTSTVVARNTTPVAEMFGAKVYPNPSTEFFMLQVTSSDRSAKITVRIIDAFGRTVQVFDNVAADRTIQFGDKLASGSYYAEITQGDERKVISLMKAK